MVRAYYAFSDGNLTWFFFPKFLVLHIQILEVNFSGMKFNFLNMWIQNKLNLNQIVGMKSMFKGK